MWPRKLNNMNSERSVIDLYRWGACFQEEDELEMLAEGEYEDEELDF